MNAVDGTSFRLDGQDAFSRPHLSRAEIRMGIFRGPAKS
jgi:hypothetical protein